MSINLPPVDLAGQQAVRRRPLHRRKRAKPTKTHLELPLRPQFRGPSLKRDFGKLDIIQLYLRDTMSSWQLTILDTACF